VANHQQMQADSCYDQNSHTDSNNKKGLGCSWMVECLPGMCVCAGPWFNLQHCNNLEVKKGIQPHLQRDGSHYSRSMINAPWFNTLFQCWNWTWGLMHVRQRLKLLSYIPSQLIIFQYWDLNSEPHTAKHSTTWATLPALFCVGYFWDSVLHFA
jgi:hypothetical protein